MQASKSSFVGNVLQAYFERNWNIAAAKVMEG